MGVKDRLDDLSHPMNAKRGDTDVPAAAITSPSDVPGLAGGNFSVCSCALLCGWRARGSGLVRRSSWVAAQLVYVTLRRERPWLQSVDLLTRRLVTALLH